MTAPALPLRTGPARRRRPRSDRVAYGFVAPNLILLAVFVLLPLVGTFVLSAQRTNGFGSGTFVGLGNYARLAADPLFWRSTLNTAIYTGLVTPLSMGLGLLVALLLNSVLPARAVFRSILILPMAVSSVASALIGKLVFDENAGVVNAALQAVGLPTIPWQSGGVPAFASVVLVTLWLRVGFNMLIYLAALQGISQDLLEAATLDGARGWKLLRSVTIPLLGPASFFLVIIDVIYSFQVFDIVFVLTAGGPQDATSVLVTYAYQNGFVTRDQGYAAAIGIVLLVLAVAFAVFQWRTNRTRDLTE
jgi:multiple sugar transport system permease protein